MNIKLDISKKIILLLISLCTLTAFVASYTSIKMMEKHNFKTIEDNLVKLNMATYNQIDTAVRTSIKSYIKAIAEKDLEITEQIYERVQSGEITELEGENLLTDLLKSETVGLSGYVFVTNSDGMVVMHPYLDGYDAIGHEFVDIHTEKKEGYLEYEWENPVDSMPRQKVVYMSYFEPWDYIICVSAYKSEFVHLVETDDFRENILDLKFNNSGYMYVMDATGTLVIHPSLEGENLYNAVDSEGNYFVREMLHKKYGSIIYPWKTADESTASDKFVVYDYYAPMQWYICSGLNLDELTMPLLNIEAKLIGIMIILLLIITFIAFYYSKIIINPIKELIKSMQKVKDGDYDSRISIKQNDEIGQLSNIYNEMIDEIAAKTDHLQTLNNKLTDVNKSLEEKVAERTKKLKELSNIDGLTGIANRRRLDQYLTDMLNIAKRDRSALSVIMIDIDFFKMFNDTYGHLEGDKSLKKVATAIHQSLKRSSDFVGRYGGEEFFVVLLNNNEEQAMKVSEYILEQIRELKIPNVGSTVSDYLTISLGVVTLGYSKQHSIDDVYALADSALYRAKNSGRNRSEVVRDDLLNEIE